MKMKIKGNELAWVLRLAERQYDSKEFREWVKKNGLKELGLFLQELMCKFHPNNFNAGDSEKIWILTDEKVAELGEAKP